ncbi:MAG: nitrogen fixation protein NifH [Candidatus Thorarchaeota archaeon]
MNWEDYISNGVLDWLLEPENPSVRYWTLRHLIDKGEQSKDVKDTQNGIMESQCVVSILGALKPEGYWGDEDDMYNPKYTATTHNLLILAELGTKRVQVIEKVIEHVFLFQRNSGHFLIKLPKTEKGRASIVKDGCCIDGNILNYLIHFGYLSDPRTQHLIEFQEEYYSQDEGGWKCRAYPIDPSTVFPANCYMGREKMLRGLAAIPENKRSKKLQSIIDREIEVVLENGLYKYLRNPDGSRKEKAGWKRFGFPIFYQSDILEILNILSSLRVRDDRMQDAIDVVLTTQQKDGKWLLKHTFNGKMVCEIDEKHKPSKWITLRALRALKGFYGG